MGAAVEAWRPGVPGLTEVFHARFTDHAYPSHTHDAWTLLLVDDGAVRYDLDRHPHGASRTEVTLLPPGVPHDGRSQFPAASASACSTWRQRRWGRAGSATPSTIPPRHGIPPHRYLTGRRIDLARRLLLDGRPAAEVSVAAGFHDQAHLTRHFRRMLATTPAAYARSA